MDQELIAYLDERFGKIDERFQRVDERFQETNQQIVALREETSQQFVALRQETSQQFEGVDAQFKGVDAHFEGVDAHFKKVDARLGQLDNSVQETRVLLEDMDGKVRLVAEGVIGCNEKLESFRKEFVERSEEILSIVRRMPPYAHLDGRVGALESWRERLGQDPIQLIREKFGLGKAP